MELSEGEKDLQEAIKRGKEYEKRERKYDQELKKWDEVYKKLGNFIRRLYPKESISSIRLKNLTNQFGMASLATSVINFDMDMPSSRINDEAASRLKQITGGDSMNIPRKYRDDALLERRIKFVFSSNHPLIIDGEDEALLKRITYLPFNYAIPDDQQDPCLGEKIWAERCYRHKGPALCAKTCITQVQLP